MATFTQALEWLKQGKKVYRKTWIWTRYISMDEYFTKTAADIEYSFGRADLQATDWQLYNDGQQFGLAASAKVAPSSSSAGKLEAADTSLTTELSVSPSLAAKILKLAEKENKRTPRKRRKSR